MKFYVKFNLFGVVVFYERIKSSCRWRFYKYHIKYFPTPSIETFCIFTFLSWMIGFSIYVQNEIPINYLYNIFRLNQNYKSYNMSKLKKKSISKFHFPVKLFEIRKKRYDTKLFGTKISANFFSNIFHKLYITFFYLI